MKRITLAAIVLVMLSGCAINHRTYYAPMGESGGYAEHDLDHGVSVTRFAGNAFTTAQDAQTFSAFRAIETCQERGFKATDVFGQKDLSTSKQVMETVGNTQYTPNYTYGWNPKVQAMYSGVNASSQATAWTDTYNYPTYDTYFRCTNSLRLARLMLKPLSADDVKDYAKDLMGALQVTDVIDGSPNAGKMQMGDIILKVNGQRVTNLANFTAAINSASNPDKIKFTLVRDGKRKHVYGKSIDGTDLIVNANASVITSACNAPEVKKRAICSLRMPASK